MSLKTMKSGGLKNGTLDADQIWDISNSEIKLGPFGGDARKHAVRGTFGRWELRLRHYRAEGTISLDLTRP